MPGTTTLTVRLSGALAEFTAANVGGDGAYENTSEYRAGGRGRLFGVEGCFFRYEPDVVHWRRLANGEIGIVATLRERMHRIDRFREEFAP